MGSSAGDQTRPAVPAARTRLVTSPRQPGQGAPSSASLSVPRRVASTASTMSVKIAINSAVIISASPLSAMKNPAHTAAPMRRRGEIAGSRLRSSDSA